MTSADILSDAFGRIREVVHEVLDGLDPEDLDSRLDGETNSICWLIWHLTRVQDDHVCEVAATEQAWTASGWAARFDLPLDLSDVGYGQNSSQVAVVKAAPEDLLGYHDEVYQNTLEFLGGVSDSDLERVVDKRWDPPVTLGVRLVSVVGDDLQHAGQAAFLRGILERRR